MNTNTPLYHVTPQQLAEICLNANADVTSQLEKLVPPHRQIEVLSKFYTEHKICPEVQIVLRTGIEDSRMATIFKEEDEVLTYTGGYTNTPLINNSNRERYMEYFTTELILSRIYLLIKSKWFKDVLSPKDCPWTYNDVGRAQSRIRIFYSTLGNIKNGKYLALFGTPVAINGAFSGYYPHSIKVYDVMATGCMTTSGASPMSVPMDYVVGSFATLNRGERHAYSMAPNTYMVDMGEGNISLALEQGIFHPALMDRDWKSAEQQIKEDVKAVEKSCTIL